MLCTHTNSADCLSSGWFYCCYSGSKPSLPRLLLWDQLSCSSLEGSLAPHSSQRHLLPTWYITPSTSKEKIGGRSAAMEPIHLLLAPSEHKSKHLSGRGAGLFVVQYLMWLSSLKGACQLPPAWRRYHSGHTMWIRTPVWESSQLGSGPGHSAASVVGPQSFCLSGSQFLL